MKFSKTLILFFVAAMVCASLQGQEKDKHEHASMRKEHQDSMKDHLEWTNQLYGMRVEHRKALAALAKIRAEILEHEAEIEATMQQINAHEFEMRMHEQAMHHHDETGHGHDHDRLMKEHAAIEKRHIELKNQISESSEHHHDLISGVLDFAEKHRKKFHNHDHDHSHNHSD